MPLCSVTIPPFQRGLSGRWHSHFCGKLYRSQRVFLLPRDMIVPLHKLLFWHLFRSAVNEVYPAQCSVSENNICGRQKFTKIQNLMSVLFRPLSEGKNVENKISSVTDTTEWSTTSPSSLYSRFEDPCPCMNLIRQTHVHVHTTQMSSEIRSQWVPEKMHCSNN